jgi:hypothetical protein
MKSKTKNIHHVNKNMMNALTNLSITMCHAFIQNKDEMPSQVNMFLDLWKNEKMQVNIIVSNDD